MALRTFNLNHDLDVMIPLIKASFHYPEHDAWTLSPEEITDLVDGFRLIRRLQPIFRIGGLFNPTLKAVMRGYIWEEDNQAVGLVNLSPLGLDSHTWAIGNVAVLPEHRRKGIAAQLIQAAVDLARQHQIKNVVLEVIADNLPAVRLYENKGFEIYSTLVQLHRDAALEAPPLLDLPSGYQIAPYHTRDWETRYTLMKDITPPAVQHYEPIHRTKFRKSLPMRLLRSLVMTLAPMTSTSYLVRDETARTVVARFACHQRRKAGGMNEIEIDLAPGHAGLAAYLVHRCVHDTVKISPGRDIQLRIAGWQPDVPQAALAAGFVSRAEWYMMGMQLALPSSSGGLNA